MPSAEIITIGSELLLGEILDSNAQYLAQKLREAGIDHYWSTTVGDNITRIAEAIRLGLSRSDILLCTGGLGPTVDDVSREGLAAGLALELEFQEELWREIQKRFENFGQTATENNKRQAFIPKDGTVLDNPNGSAPAFLVDRDGQVVVSMPGVPGEMFHIMEESVLPYLEKRFGKSAAIHSRILHTAGVGESVIDERIADFEAQKNPTVGMAAHMGAVDIRLTAKAKSAAQADDMLDKLEEQIRARIGDWIFGKDGESQGDAIAAQLGRLNWRLAIAGTGFGGHLEKIFTGLEGQLGRIEKIEAGKAEALAAKAQALSKSKDDIVGLAAQLEQGQKQIELLIAIATPNKESQFRFPFWGSRGVGAEWASKKVAEILRRALAKEEEKT